MATPSPLKRSDIQGIALHGYKHMDFAGFLLVQVESSAACRRWLGRRLGDVTKADAKAPHECLNLAFTFPGLERLRPADARWSGFSPEFTEGMVTPARQRILGDHAEGPNDPAQWRWGGPTTPEIHLLVMLYAPNEPALLQRLDELTGEIEGHGMSVREKLVSHPLRDGREHFGFHDGIANPVVSTAPGAPNNVAAGEFILGYANESGVVPAAPTLVDPQSQSPWGGNGSYLVFRQISQDVNGFWAGLKQLTAQAPRPDPDAAAVRLGAKMMGRWPGGAPLAVFPDAPPDASDGKAQNLDSFGYQANDPEGLKCPFGSHVRRANPRDGLPPDAATSQAMAKKHRLLRRGRSYGLPVSDFTGPEAVRVESKHPGSPATPDRGLFFLALGADLKAQFEFVQQTWLNSRKFPDAYDSFDPIGGLPGRRDTQAVTTFVVPACPAREHYTGMASFTRIVGGAYFFLPGLEALARLADPGPEAKPPAET